MRFWTAKNRGTRLPSRFRPAAVAALVLLIAPHDCMASFHDANIAEIMTSYDGNANIQFVEIVMNAAAENFVRTTKLSAFDADGNFTSVLLTVPNNVQSGAGRRWIMATAAFESASGLSADFLFAAGLPTAGGMVCWGMPNDPADPEDYVDCVAYGSYTGPTNSHIGMPTYLLPVGHSLRRTADTDDSLMDFDCSDPADPENNAFATVSLSATTTCTSCGNNVTESAEQCDGTDDTVCPGQCSPPGGFDECLCVFSTTTTLSAGPTCGDATGDTLVTATDALVALAAAVGAGACEQCVCDVNQVVGIHATDALLILTFAVGQPITLNCPAC